MKPWAYWPNEIRFMILKSLVQQTACAPYASVSREWQLYMERVNFAQLKLSQSCLDDFARMTAHLRGLVRHVWLAIELPQYGEPSESTSGDLISRAINKLFEILSKWRPAAGGLRLELSMYSPTERGNWFKNCYFGGHGESKDIPKAPVAVRCHARNWGRGQVVQPQPPPASAILRLCSEMNVKGVTEDLANVRAVTSFVIRRQCRRSFGPMAVRLLLNKLPRLERFVYEPWRPWQKHLELDYDYQTLFGGRLPKGLKSISLFEDFNDEYAASIMQSGGLRPPSPNATGAPFGPLDEDLAYRSLKLEHFHGSFIVDARRFFDACQPTWTWDRLVTLSLTTQKLHSTVRLDKIGSLLRDAGTAALGMPSLRTMALWNRDKKEACVFMYSHKERLASITWRATWALELEIHVIGKWEQVAAKHSPLGRLVVHKQKLQCAEFRSHGDAIAMLELPSGVIDPVSLWQIQREGKTSRQR